MNNVETTLCTDDEHRAPVTAPPTSRADIYYWKCDSPLPGEEKLVYNRKYKVADILPVVEQIGREFFRTSHVLPWCVAAYPFKPRLRATPVGLVL